MIIDEKDYKFKFFYYNKKNSELFVRSNTKRAAFAVNGNVINFAHPIGKVMGFFVGLMMIVIILLVVQQL